MSSQNLLIIQNTREREREKDPHTRKEENCIQFYMASLEVFNLPKSSTSSSDLNQLFCDNIIEDSQQLLTVASLEKLTSDTDMFDEVFDSIGDGDATLCDEGLEGGGGRRGSGGSGGGSIGSGSLEESVGSLSDGLESQQDCKICHNKFNSPRVLSCLHVFCESCLDNQRLIDGASDSRLNTHFECPTCTQKTKVRSFYSIPFSLYEFSLIFLSSY